MRSRSPRALTAIVLALGVLALGLVAAGSAAAQGVDKVTICHKPPGNPENAQTIEVGRPAVAAHVALHDDTIGACDEDDDDDDDDSNGGSED